VAASTTLFDVQSGELSTCLLSYLHRTESYWTADGWVGQPHESTLQPTDKAQSLFNAEAGLGVKSKSSRNSILFVSSNGTIGSDIQLSI
jgi:hypothetical protein